ncbi:hypothetical protein [Streptomyces sp. NPDC051561]|uniref:hypothetical protein n=1 Tax=Streptomyces sp. NPDC051561 TaxID=3365658 RepID=UPI00378D46E3
MSAAAREMQSPGNPDPAQDPVALWASAQVTTLGAVDCPEYGSPAWSALRAADPRRAAAIITAAEQWRRHNAREAWLDHLLIEDPERWFAHVTAEANAYAARIAPALARRPTFDELAARRSAQVEPREVVAAAGWPPVAIPGRPGYWRHRGAHGAQLDLPYNTRQEMAA